MSNPAQLAADPAWLPHRIDFAGQRVMFLHLNRAELAQSGFLAEREKHARQAWMPLERYVEGPAASGPIHFVFHSGFCRSTLMVRALTIPGVALGLNEPGILNSVAQAGAAGASLVAPTVRWLSRPHAMNEAIVVKPSNYASALIEPMLDASPASRAVLMTSRTAAFLTRVARKGLVGRLWGRQVFLELHKLAGNDLGLDLVTVAGLSDMQTAALGWFLKQQMFTDIARGPHHDRVAILHGDRFNAARAQTLAAMAAHFGIELGRGHAEAIAQGPVFATHAKGGGEFSATEARNEERGASTVTDEEIAQVDRWVAGLARQGGWRVPIPQTLF